MVGAGPEGQRVHPGVAAAAAGDGGGVAAGLPPPARPLVAPHQVGDPCRERGDNMSGMILWQSKGVISCVRQSDVDDAFLVELQVGGVVAAGVIAPGAAIQGDAAHAAARAPRPVGESTPKLIACLLNASRA